MSDDFDRCYSAALRILNVRFNSEVELRRKLWAKQFDKPTVEATLIRLRHEKWLDDERFADAFVRSRMRKRIGPLRIRRELIAAGVDDQAAAMALQRNSAEDEERGAAVALAERRARILVRRHGPQYLASPEGRNKLTAYLLNQGYERAVVHEIVRECLKRAANIEQRAED